MKKRVLIVEDFADIRMMMSIALRHFGFDVLEAADGCEALEKAVEEKPDLVLMDIGLPVLNGIEATKAIRQNPDLAETPIIAVTAYDTYFKEKAIEAGCNAVVPKPVQFEYLNSLINYHLADSGDETADGPSDMGLT